MIGLQVNVFKIIEPGPIDRHICKSSNFFRSFQFMFRK
jgi:hypothetical protein